MPSVFFEKTGILHSHPQDRFFGVGLVGLSAVRFAKRRGIVARGAGVVTEGRMVGQTFAGGLFNFSFDRPGRSSASVWQPLQALFCGKAKTFCEESSVSTWHWKQSASGRAVLPRWSEWISRDECTVNFGVTGWQAVLASELTVGCWASGVVAFAYTPVETHDTAPSKTMLMVVTERERCFAMGKFLSDKL